MKQKQIRGLHRDLGYFYIGLIIAFAFSGILMNHREVWKPEKYTVETREIQVQLPAEELISEKYIDKLKEEIKVDDKMRRFNIKEGKLKISFEKNDVEIDMKSGTGEVVSFIKIPFISQTMKLHKNTSNWWIYYGDIFGISLIVIAVTGAIMIPAGKFTFKKRGWKLALAGLIFPLIFLFLLA